VSDAAPRAETAGTEESAAAPVAAVPPRSVVREYFDTIVICVLVILFLQAFVVMRSKVPSGSMLDTLLIGDYILINRGLYGAPGEGSAGWPGQRPIERGDVLVFQSVEDPDIDLVKRVVGLPGETIRLARGRVLVDGQVLDEPYVLDGNNRFHQPYGPIVVPEDSYFMLGDNRDTSRDSRYWGTVPRSLVKGRAFLIWWSYREDPNDYRENVGVKRLLAILKKIPRLGSHTRWERLFSRVR
jgi:signal peptidase I